MGDRVEHLTGSERASLEHEVGPLQEVGDRGDLVRVPEEVAREKLDRPEAPINEESSRAEIEAADELREAGQGPDEEHAGENLPIGDPSHRDGDEERTDGVEDKGA